MYKVDLHTHSEASPDGGLTLRDYRAMLDGGGLDYVAITDHDSITFARQARADLGGRLIIGEEISTREGELIGLFLREAVPAGLSAPQAAQLVHEQGGLVYVPHPFETVRHGLPADVLESLIGQLDIVEVFNGRAWAQNKSSEARAWAARHDKAGAASSDAHGRRGWGRTYSIIDQAPTPQNLNTCLQRAKLIEQSVGLRGLLYPKLNRLKKGGDSRV